MNTLFFKYAIEIERTRSITRAANNLYMAQPNLSKAIKELEESIGFPVFERNSKGVFPTKKGIEFLDRARKILEQINEISRLSNSEQPNQQNFSISIPRGSYIAAAFTQFVEELDFDKAIKIDMQETNSVQTVNNVVEKKFNLGIIRYQSVYENYFLDYLAEKRLLHEQIWEFEYLALMSKKHRLAEVKEVLFSELKTSIEIIHGDTVVPYLNAADIRQSFSDTMSSDQAAGKKRIYLYERGNQFDLLCTIPATYMWVSPIPEKLLTRYKLIQRKCEFANNQYKDLLVYPEGYEFSPLDKKFIDKMVKSKNALAARSYS
ncbi:MAG: LysR family transcriptional regulator [Spirochaetaceae bacterium]|jgi:DNA-binding transcriptional LysR family regulator|nr:LysR family transcriptional regulator [Spirochaetaceae bacterium]